MREMIVRRLISSKHQLGTRRCHWGSLLLSSVAVKYEGFPMASFEERRVGGRQVNLGGMMMLERM